MSLQLKLFGGPAVVDLASGTPRVSRRHRLAILAILGAANAPVSRERILALLWPDSSDERGRHALGQLLYGLRQDLALGDIVSGANELSLDRSALTCDLWTFREALARGERREAIAGYSAPFLDGFLLPDAGEFSRWIEEERAAIARQANDAMESLAAAASEEGNHIEATQWWRRLATSDPLSSRTALSLMRTLVASGDRAAAIQHARLHTAMVRAELDADPDPALLAYEAELRTTPPPPPPSPPPASLNVRGTETPVLPETTPKRDPSEDVDGTPHASESPRLTTSLSADATTPRRPRFVIGAVFAVVAAALIALAAFSLRTRQQPRAPVNGIPVAVVLPFDVKGDSSHGYLGEALSALLSARLDAPGILRTIESNAVLNALRGDGDVRRSDADARLAALGGSAMVRGTIVVLGDRLEIDAQLSPSEGGNGAAVRANVSGSADSLFALADQLGARLLIAREGRPLGGSAMGGTQSVSALKSFLAAERARRGWHLVEAANAYRAATDIDSTYALAWYRLAGVENWGHIGDGGRDAMMRARRNAAQLPVRYALLLDAIVARLTGDVSNAEQKLLTVVQRYPDDSEAWLELGEFRYHSGPTLGHPASDADVPLTRALSLDSVGRPEARLHLVQISYEVGDTARARTVGAPFLASPESDDRTVQFIRFMAALSSKHVVHIDSFVETIRHSPPREATMAMHFGVIGAGGISPDVRAYTDSLRSPASPPRSRVVALTFAMEIAAAQQSWGEVAARGAELARIDSIAAAEAWGLVAFAPGVTAADSTWRRAGSMLEVLAQRDTSSSRANYLREATILAARAGDAAAFDRRYAALASRPHPNTSWQAMLRTLRAFRAEVAHDSAGVDREMSVETPYDWELGRWLRGRQLERRGELMAARGWYLGSIEGNQGLVLTRDAYERVAAIDSARGERKSSEFWRERARGIGGVMK